MQWTSITKTDCTIHSIVIYPVDRVIHLLNNWAQIFSRPGSIKSSTLNFKNKTVNWSLRQEEWRHKINTENKNKVVLTVLLETRLVLLLHVFHTWLHPDGRGTWGPFLESPVNLTGPKSNIQIEVERIRTRVLASKLVHFVSLTDSFVVLGAKLLKPRSVM